MDFGLSKVLGSATVVTKTLSGTPCYMAPEQIAEGGEISPRVDVYALGVILYRLLARRLPYEDENPLALLDRVLREEPVPLMALRPDLPRPLTAVVDRALIKQAGTRPALDELLGEIEQALAGRWASVLAWGQPEAERTVTVGWGPPQRPAAASQDPERTLPLLPLPRLPRRRAPLALLACLALVAASAGLLLARLATRARPLATAVSAAGGPAAPVDARASVPDTALVRRADAATEPRRLWLTTTPPGALVQAGRRRLGKTPLEGAPLPPGPLTLRIRHAGYHDELRPAQGGGDLRLTHLRLRPTSARTTPARLSVTAKRGELMVTASIYLDGRKIGETPLSTTVPAGPHTLEARWGTARQRAQHRLASGANKPVVFRFR
jgi:hypothetical protein